MQNTENYLKINYKLLSVKSLPIQDKCILSQIISFQKNGSFYMKNTTLSETFGLSVRTIENIMARIKKLPFIRCENSKKPKAEDKWHNNRTITIDMNMYEQWIKKHSEHHQPSKKPEPKPADQQLVPPTEEVLQVKRLTFGTPTKEIENINTDINMKEQTLPTAPVKFSQERVNQFFTALDEKHCKWMNHPKDKMRKITQEMIRVLTVEQLAAVEPMLPEYIKTKYQQDEQATN